MPGIVGQQLQFFVVKKIYQVVPKRICRKLLQRFLCIRKLFRFSYDLVKRAAPSGVLNTPAMPTSFFLFADIFSCCIGFTVYSIPVDFAAQVHHNGQQHKQTNTAKE